jgi:hypothetical protein
MPDELDEDVGPVIVVHSDEPQKRRRRGALLGLGIQASMSSL